MAKTLIAYFSHAGQNYTHGGIGYLEVGNTEVVAKKLHKLVDSDLFYIDTVKKYPDDHMEKIAAAKKEYEENARPALTAKVENMDEYENVILAFPNWWTTMPMALFTFLLVSKKFALLKKPVNPSRFRTHPAVPELSALCIILAVFLKGGKNVSADSA